jgi:hypothetical protein
MLLMVTAFGKNAPKHGAPHKRCTLKYAAKILSEMLVKQNCIFCVIHFMLVPLGIGQIGE